MMKREPRVKRALIAALLAVLLFCLWNVGLLDPTRLANGARNIALFGRDLFPPDWGVLGTVAHALLETLQIAFAGTVLGFAIALPLSLLASHLLFPAPLAAAAKLALAFIRTVPTLLWAIVFVVAFGLGPAAGTLGVAFYTTGYLGKIFYEAYEAVDAEVLEAVRSVGCSRVQLARYALLPEAANILLAQALFMFEYNVRASAILGFVGAGGIGFYLLGYIQSLRYDRLMTALLATLAVVILIDRLSAWVRSMVLVPVQKRRRARA